MRWTTYAIGIPLGCFVLAANIEPAAAQEQDQMDKVRQVRRTIHEEHDPITNTAFSSTVDDQGNARVTVTVDGFTLEKAVASSGDATLRIVDGKDIVSIAINHRGYVVARGKKTARFDPESGRQEDLDAVRAVLLGSPAVRTFRRLSASLEAHDEGAEEGPILLGTLVDGAIVQMLDGDPGATRRIAKRITRKQRARIQPALLRPGGVFSDCVLGYEVALMDAWDLFYDCSEAAISSSWYIRWGAETFCEFEFLLRSQQYIYQFMSCFAYPF
jgi:hypothetical protein